MHGEGHEHTAGALAHPGLTALERGLALARATRAALEQHLRQAEAIKDAAGVARFRRALLIADRRVKRLGGVLGRERRRLAGKLQPGQERPTIQAPGKAKGRAQ
jgi:hypothetical protein